MIIDALLNAFLQFFQLIISIFNLPVITELPFGIDGILTTAVSYYHGITETVPYLQVVWNCFLFVLAFEVVLLVLKLVLGSRLPAHTIN